MISHEVTPNGNLKFSVDLKNPEVTDMLSEFKDFTDIIHEHFEPNGVYEVLLPEDIGALTAAPIIGKDVERGENFHDVYVYHAGSVWWFPNYEVEDPLETLREKGEVIFTKA